ncbi:Sodium/potassium/calcium exchanger Nckx30C [Rhynchospora pubera]|uniref:Sodium/potassium/calcium exchanger Nckx30C n=1 Tax=Rhynchospora pubera TaxID=906938 RepID=A0AAV8DNG4_9POAL|nr:Sodium/potassium/calcium exchanger Nckx30C [Rhynchospora pubera]
MLPIFFFFVIFLQIPTTSFAVHNITISPSTPLRLSSLAWDPIRKHFIVGSSDGPTVYTVSDAGMVKRILSNTSSEFVSSLAVDHVRHLLIVAFSNSSSVAAYDIKSYHKVCELPLPQLNGSTGGVAVDMENGEVLVTSSRSGIVLKVLLDGDGSIISEYKINDDHGLGSIVYVNGGSPYFLVIQNETGKIFEVRSKDGIVNKILSSRKLKMLALSGNAMALQSGQAVLVAGIRSLFSLEKDVHYVGIEDGKKYDMTVMQPHISIENGDQLVAVATREGKKSYALVKSPVGYRIEEVEWSLTWHTYLLAVLCPFFVVVLIAKINETMKQAAQLKELEREAEPQSEALQGDNISSNIPEFIEIMDGNAKYGNANSDDSTDITIKEISGNAKYGNANSDDSADNTIKEISGNAKYGNANSDDSTDNTIKEMSVE